MAYTVKKILLGFKLKLKFQILSGLAYIHGESILHRDIKPANVVVDLSNNLVVKIIDFGLARDASAKDDGNHDPRTICYDDFQWSNNGTDLYQPSEQVLKVILHIISLKFCK